jgi:hypothetical protein
MVLNSPVRNFVPTHEMMSDMLILAGKAVPRQFRRLYDWGSQSCSGTKDRPFRARQVLLGADGLKGGGDCLRTEAEGSFERHESHDVRFVQHSRLGV